jgi:CRP-like cAMP-binding protein
MDAARLKEIPLFADLDDHELNVVATFGTEASWSSGAVMVREGDFAYELLVLSEGSAEVTRAGEHLADLGAGDFVGESGVIGKTTRNATVTAKDGVRAFCFTAFDVKRLRKLGDVAAKLDAAAAERA